MNTNFTQAPLPFQGQKRKWNKIFKETLKDFNNYKVFVDLFGGSGLLSRMVKDVCPDAKVIFNDFDDYSKRICNIQHTNALLRDLREMLAGYPDAKLIREPLRSEILSRIKQEEEQNGYVDYITLSSSLLFSMKYATDFESLAGNSMYNNVRQNDYNADGYLDGIEVVRQDYRELFRQWKDRTDVCFLIDPPYLSTDVGTYQGYWKLKDYLDVLQTLEGSNYFYFTSNKSSIVELCEWMANNCKANNPFHGAVKKELTATMNYNSSFTDIMIYKRFTA